MGFINILDKITREFEELKDSEKDNTKKIIFMAITSKLLNLRTVYCNEAQEELNKVQRVED